MHWQLQGINKLGRHFDQNHRLLSTAEFKKENGTDRQQTKMALQRLKDAAEKKRKKDLSVWLQLKSACHSSLLVRLDLHLKINDSNSVLNSRFNRDPERTKTPVRRSPFRSRFEFVRNRRSRPCWWFNSYPRRCWRLLRLKQVKNQTTSKPWRRSCDGCRYPRWCDHWWCVKDAVLLTVTLSLLVSKQWWSLHKTHRPQHNYSNI